MKHTLVVTAILLACAACGGVDPDSESNTSDAISSGARGFPEEPPTEGDPAGDPSADPGTDPYPSCAFGEQLCCPNVDVQQCYCLSWTVECDPTPICQGLSCRPG